MEIGHDLVQIGRGLRDAPIHKLPGDQHQGPRVAVDRIDQLFDLALAFHVVARPRHALALAHNLSHQLDGFIPV